MDTNTILGNKHKHIIKHWTKSLSTTEYITEPPSNFSLDTGFNKHLYNINITNTTKWPACDYKTETVTLIIY